MARHYATGKRDPKCGIKTSLTLNERAYESGSTVIVKTVCYGTFSGGDLGGGKLKATFKSFRARAISVLELNEASQILACTEYYDRSTMPIGDATPFDQLPWPDKDLAEAPGNGENIQKEGTIGKRASAGEGARG